MGFANGKARIGATAKGGICRLTLTDLDRQVRDWLKAQCDKIGCSVAIDEVGNMFARRTGKNAKLLPIAIGSHLDTQPTGGKFDGPLGVLAGLEVLRPSMIAAIRPMPLLSSSTGPTKKAPALPPLCSHREFLPASLLPITPMRAPIATAKPSATNCGASVTAAKKRPARANLPACSSCTSSKGRSSNTKAAVETAGYSYRNMISGAGHDAVYVARVAPTTMIFVPSRGGISHNEAEYSSPEDCAAGAQVLLNAVLEYDQRLAAKR